MTSTLKKFVTTTSASGLLAAGVLLGATGAAQAAPGGPSGCTAYVSQTDNHTAVGWCRSGSGTWNVQAMCAGPGSTHGPYKGDPGYRTRGTEKAATLNCGGGYPTNLKVVDIKS